MSFTIVYRHPQRSDEARMTVVAGHANAAVMKTSWKSRFSDPQDRGRTLCQDTRSISI